MKDQCDEGGKKPSIEIVKLCSLAALLVVVAVLLIFFWRHAKQYYFAAQLAWSDCDAKDFALYIQMLEESSTEEELGAMALAPADSRGPYGKLNGAAELALARKDTTKSHRILESLLRDAKSDQVFAIRGLVASKSYNQNVLFDVVEKDKKLLSAALMMHIAYNRVDYLPKLRQYYKNIYALEPDSYTGAKLKRYLLKHGALDHQSELHDGF